uniref:Uncharacterized protein n=2 Tax=Sipha flava TaxID=143950 RepID=A0A2S2QGP9_9HEMI
MQIREKQLKKESKKIMKNLELSLLRHTSIYNKAVSKFDSLKGNKINIQSFLKKLENLRSAIEKKKKECEGLTTCANNLQHNKLELECKVASLNVKTTNVEKDISDLTATIKDLERL